MPKGTIRRLMRDRGYGFIRAEDGKDVFFRRSTLPGPGFDLLREGQVVEFEMEKGPKGPRAVKVGLKE